MKKLLIVESPAKIKTISKFLGKDFKVMSTVGHIKDLPAKEIGVEINDNIKIDYVTLEGKEKTISDICKEARNSDEVFLATDPDREGEIIAWHIGQEIEKVFKNKEHMHRIIFNEITKPAIEAAIKNQGIVDADKVAAQQARRVLDRLVGYEVSPILWRKITKGLSAGRVQSVALRLICNREDAIRVFKVEEYWSIECIFTALMLRQAQHERGIIAPLTSIGKKKAEIKSKDEADKLAAEIKAEKSYIISAIKDSKRLKNPAAPFMTSTLQQSAYNALGFSVQKTMQVAQSLYEGVPLEDSSTPVALITYMRTDSLRISEVAIKSSREFILKNYGKEYLPASAQSYSTDKKIQDGHEAIRPIDVNIKPEDVSRYLGPDAAKLYDLIWKRFVACQMKQAQYAQRQITITGGKFVFKTTGSTMLFDGFLKVYKDDEENEDTEGKNILPENITENLALDLGNVLPKQHFTQPPPRFTEGSLVKELKDVGIGRPSTYATILKTIQARSYTELDAKKRFVPTELGMAVTKMLTDNLPKIMDVNFTATMEEDLDKVAEGNLKRDTLIKDFYKDFSKDLDTFRGEQLKKQVEITTLDCPDCHVNKLAIRFGKAGSFLGCVKFPECKFTSNFTRMEDGTIILAKNEEPQMLSEKCPKCSSALREVVGKFGQFVSCSGYPGCKYIKQNKAGFKCPTCKEGDVLEKNWKGKKFWGCSSYPNCKFSISGDIEEVPCTGCQAPYMLKRTDRTGKVTLMCDNKACGLKI